MVDPRISVTIDRAHAATSCTAAGLALRRASVLFANVYQSGMGEIVTTLRMRPGVVTVGDADVRHSVFRVATLHQPGRVDQVSWLIANICIAVKALRIGNINRLVVR